jgi:hypothetical protein
VRRSEIVRRGELFRGCRGRMGARRGEQCALVSCKRRNEDELEIVRRGEQCAYVSSQKVGGKGRE